MEHAIPFFFELGKELSVGVSAWSEYYDVAFGILLLIINGIFIYLPRCLS